MKKEREGQVYLAEVEHMPGFCPVCYKPVDIIVSEDSRELFGVCSECGNMLFYSNKLSSVEGGESEGVSIPGEEE